MRRSYLDSEMNETIVEAPDAYYIVGPEDSTVDEDLLQTEVVREEVIAAFVQGRPPVFFLPQGWGIVPVYSHDNDSGCDHSGDDDSDT